MRASSRRIGWVVVMAALLSVTAACGGNGSAPIDKAPPGPRLSKSERAAIIHDIEEKFRSLPGVDAAADNAALLAWARTRPEFVETGLDRGCVWVVFKDGVELLDREQRPPTVGSGGTRLPRAAPEPVAPRRRARPAPPPRWPCR